ncbi:DNA-directed RNA polymerase III subunit RPC7-like isoform X1 [Syngnathoides biaculeatus]|uniref:DNA-directed RNA polymerase III subunit RPC7-like isoform X1 n=1 Tax=Syngnathoides biaculeatus TaxID=300417 RepID=UPI002ADE5207|nr:DNA-directed RNA polymerase III subunit RPC7-like isoform X1 [Syngnathoides biaculeatus]
MSGRGRGRRGAPSCMGVLNRSENLPPSVQLPSPLFPPMEHNPLPLACSEEAEYLLALKQEFRGAMKTRPGFIQPQIGQRSNADVERYSDKYHNSSEQTDALSNWIPDWKRFPKEIRLCVRRTLKKGASTVVVGSKRDQADDQKKTVKEKKEVLLKLERTRSTEAPRTKMTSRRKRRKRSSRRWTRTTTRKSWRRRPITSCPTSTMAKTLAQKVTTTWTKPFTETCGTFPWQCTGDHHFFKIPIQAFM